ncbi:uncharacterized protein I303_104374 [Kwoniella dejecticola CBS 10117]|uniref:Uncharacterized protein n=1 Tax=Kwoniella dejecticola CBS 10117 TaxID=1296121 RepID=A0AAJ8MHB5_9TREE
MRSTFSTISCFFLTLSSLLHSASSKYVDLVSSSDLELAQRIDDFATENGDDIYHFIALTTQDNIIVQLRYEDDSMAFSGIFSPTPNLQDHLASVQQAIYQTTVSAGLESYSNDAASLESLQTYRYNETLFLEGQSDFYPSSPEDLQKRVCRPCWYFLRDIHERQLQKKASRCGQFCSRGAQCVMPGCTSCWYTGGNCLWQKSCV